MEIPKSGSDLAHLGRHHEDRAGRRLPIPGPMGPVGHLEVLGRSGAGVLGWKLLKVGKGHGFIQLVGI